MDKSLLLTLINALTFQRIYRFSFSVIFIILFEWASWPKYPVRGSCVRHLWWGWAADRSYLLLALAHLESWWRRRHTEVARKRKKKTKQSLQAKRLSHRQRSQTKFWQKLLVVPWTIVCANLPIHTCVSSRCHPALSQSISANYRVFNQINREI